ncbi:[Pyruvate dehydrogenase [acetyl-transferring]]-phosphatase 1, mitochondrial [Coemansia brasiliensis]|uniref:[Pyruvate dehydrogenase [acetyl-transferring]]-phosphatase 1, mitochondrial n=1 Tax=Coemansia brasiliensis TaxID=2650707 RepID=A0A9W8I8N4_9FUNG|nr:[Pyruvate dehydrogenase [acetyl-transferring]]-phosphatase 1, mitochondrial [Coemansia brasiliensis]
MAANSLRKRQALREGGQRRHQSSDSKSPSSGDSKASSSSNKSSGTGKSAAKEANADASNAGGSKRSLTFAIGGVLTLLGVAGYTFLRQPTVDIHSTATPSSSTLASPTQMALESVSTKRIEAKKKLDGLPSKERREEARRLGMLTEEEVDAVLHAKENSWSLAPSSSHALGLRVDTNQVSSNDPIEDYLAWSPLGIFSEAEADKPPSVPRYMFSVFDGHAGYMCAEQLSLRLAPMLNESLDVVSKLVSKDDSTNEVGKELVSTVKQLKRDSGIEWDQIPLALTATFIRMDYELVHGALAEFRQLQKMSAIDKLLGPAVSGSCGLVAVVDTEAKEVVVGNTGDSRALLGVRLKDGRWKAVRLSEDQTASNKKELDRMMREHPGEPSVISRGRVLGGLMPTRAFGDCRYKWPLEAQQDLFPVLYSRGHRYATTPSNYNTPPYVTAKPVIVKHQLSENDKFIVIASDGLYDQLSDEEVIDSVAQWYEARNDSKNDAGSGSTLTTQDSNGATHLIRTALSTDRLGRRSDSVIRRLLAIPPPHSRRFRDDISVTIVTLNRD